MLPGEEEPCKMLRGLGDRSQFVDPADDLVAERCILRTAGSRFHPVRASGFGHSGGLEADFLRTLPQHGLPQRGQILQTRGQGNEMIARELAHLAGEMHAAIGQQDFGFADTTGIENDLAGRWIAGVVFVRDTEIEIAERHPDPLAAPADMNSLAFERHGLAERRAGLRSQLFLESRVEGEVSGVDNELAHLLNPAIIERVSLPAPATSGKPCLGSTSMDKTRSRSGR